MERRRIRPGGEHSDLRGGVRAVRVRLESADSPAVLTYRRSARGECRMRACAIAAIVAVVSLSPPSAAAEKLTFEDRVELTRGLMAEYGTVKVLLPRSKKALEIDAADGTFDKKAWSAIAKESGPAARMGDSVQITKVE